MPAYEQPLAVAVVAAQEAGALLRQEFHRPGGPRPDADADRQAEQVIRELLLAACPWRYLGEETPPGGGDPAEPHVWVVDPHDGTTSFLGGWRGSAVSIAALRDGVPVLGVVHAFAFPDDRGDLIAWAEGCGPLRRNGTAVTVSLADAELDRRALVFVSQAADRKAAANALCVTPARFLTLPSLAYRLALVAAGEGVAAVSLGAPSSWDYAAGHALLRGADGVLVNEQGRPVRYDRDGRSQTTTCFGGAAQAVEQLVQRPWQTIATAPASTPAPPFCLVHPVPGRAVPDAALLSRAQGCLLGQFAGDSLGSLVEFQSAAQIAVRYPGGLRELADGGTWGTIAGQPTDDSELALMLARVLAHASRHDPPAVRQAYVHWHDSAPFDMGGTTRSALGHGTLLHQSQANGSLMRVSPLGILGVAAPQQAAEWARADSCLTHPNEVCQEACAVFVAAVATAVATGAGPEACHAAALAEATRSGVAPSVRQALEEACSEPPADYLSQEGWVLIALQNAFYQVLHAPTLEEGVVATVMAGGDTDTNGAIAGALLGVVHGRDAVPGQWRRAVLSCRPLPEMQVRRPRPLEFWPVDALVLAETLLVHGLGSV
jgi:ADP-ribosyl-[dinitrogen reductase] hydrolase